MATHPNVSLLTTGRAQLLGPAVTVFLAETDLAPATHRVYALTLHRLVAALGATQPLEAITVRDLTRFLASSYGHLAPASYNRVVATLGSLFAYTTAQGHTLACPGRRPGPMTAHQPAHPRPHPSHPRSRPTRLSAIHPSRPGQDPLVAVI